MGSLGCDALPPPPKPSMRDSAPPPVPSPKAVVAKPKAVPSTAERVRRLVVTPKPSQSGLPEPKPAIDEDLVRSLDKAFQGCSESPVIPKTGATPLVAFTPNGEPDANAIPHDPKPVASQVLCMHMIISNLFKHHSSPADKK